MGRFITQDNYLGEPGTPPSLHRYLYAYGNPTVYIDPNGNVAIIKYFADTLHNVNNWLKDRTDQYGDGWVAGVGAAATGITRTFVGAGEGALRSVNYVANRASMDVSNALGLEDAKWAQAHAKEVEESHKEWNDTVNYLMLEGGISDVASHAANTVDRAMHGDPAAIGNVFEFGGGLALGGAGVRQISKAAASTTRKLASTAKATATVARKSAKAVARRAPKITGEVVSSVKSAGRAVMSGKGGRLNPLNYTKDGIGMFPGNIRYKPKVGGTTISTKSEKFYRNMSQKEYDKLIANNGKLSRRTSETSELGITPDESYARSLVRRKGGGRKYQHLVEFEVNAGTTQKLIDAGAVHPSTQLLFPGEPLFKSGMKNPQLKLEKGGVQSILLGGSDEAVELFNAEIINFNTISK